MAKRGSAAVALAAALASALLFSCETTEGVRRELSTGEASKAKAVSDSMDSLMGSAMAYFGGKAGAKPDAARLYREPAERVGEAARTVLADYGVAGLEESRADDGSLVLVGEFGMTGFSLGEIVGLKISVADKGSAVATVASRRKLATNVAARDWTVDVLDGISAQLRYARDVGNAERYVVFAAPTPVSASGKPGPAPGAGAVQTKAAAPMKAGPAAPAKAAAAAGLETALAILRESGRAEATRRDSEGWLADLVEAARSAFPAKQSSDVSVACQGRYGDYLSSRFVAYAAGRTKNLRFVAGGAELEKVLAEQEVQLSGAYDEATAVRVGKLVGARYIMSLSAYTKVDSESLELHCKFLSVEDGRFLPGGAIVYVPKRELPQ
ncbi:MAG: hypothetical protein JNG85_02845 [Spirochaetaceae bacterium]|nr:hypothetical protein [Spirochaetaceae bacterium]